MCLPGWRVIFSSRGSWSLLRPGAHCPPRLPPAPDALSFCALAPLWLHYHIHTLLVCPPIQETAAALMARLATHKMETEDDFDPTRFLDRSLIRLCQRYVWKQPAVVICTAACAPLMLSMYVCMCMHVRVCAQCVILCSSTPPIIPCALLPHTRTTHRFAEYRKDDPSSFMLQPNLQYFPQFLFNLRRSQFVQVFGFGPDETAFFRLTLYKVPVLDALVRRAAALRCACGGVVSVCLLCLHADGCFVHTHTHTHARRQCSNHSWCPTASTASSLRCSTSAASSRTGCCCWTHTFTLWCSMAAPWHSGARRAITRGCGRGGARKYVNRVLRDTREGQQGSCCPRTPAAMSTAALHAGSWTR